MYIYQNGHQSWNYVINSPKKIDRCLTEIMIYKVQEPYVYIYVHSQK